MAQNRHPILGNDRKVPFKIDIWFITIQTAVSGDLASVLIKFKGKVNQLIWRCIDVISEEEVKKTTKNELCGKNSSNKKGGR